MLRLRLDRSSGDGVIQVSVSQERRGSKGIIKPTVTRPVRVQGEAVLNISCSPPAEFLIINLSFVKMFSSSTSQTSNQAETD